MSRLPPIAACYCSPLHWVPTSLDKRERQKQFNSKLPRVSFVEISIDEAMAKNAPRYTMTSPYKAELELAKSAALKAGEIIRSYSNGNGGGGRSSNSATVCVKSVEYYIMLCCKYYYYPVLHRSRRFLTHHHIFCHRTLSHHH